MMRQAILLTMAAGFALAASGAASAQVGPGGAGPIAGAGDSTRITSENRETTAAYNQRMGAADLKAKDDEKSQKKKAPVAATAADIKAGSALRAVDGPPIGSVVSITGDQVVVDTGESKIAVPLIGFGKDEKGLVLNMTAAKFKDAVAKAHAAHAAADANSN